LRAPWRHPGGANRIAADHGAHCAIRAERKGEGITLTRQQARALAGEWYHWFITRHPTSDLANWDAIRDQVHNALRETVGDAEWERSDPDKLWHQDVKLRRALYPVLADIGETAQFLAMKRLALNVEGRESFLYWLYDDLAAVLARLRRLTEGDYGDDAYAKRFPKFEGSDSGEPPQQLFERWVSERKPAYGTIESWSYVFRALQEKFGGRSGLNHARGSHGLDTQANYQPAIRAYREENLSQCVQDRVWMGIRT
jgi:hypothetical protein